METEKELEYALTQSGCRHDFLPAIAKPILPGEWTLVNQSTAIVGADIIVTFAWKNLRYWAKNNVP